jgi:stress response protein YsnF
MSQTVIALFDKSSNAQNAAERLMNNGFSHDNIDISLSTANTEAATSTESGNYKDTNESGVGRFFRSLFGEDNDEAVKYTTVAERGNSVVTVYAATTEEAQRAADVLDSSGAIDVNERATEYGYTSGSGITSKETMDTRSGNVPSSIPVVEENVQIGKREVETGGVRLRSRIVETPVEENLRLREEHVRVERTPVDRPATDADLQNFQEGEIEITEHAEVPVVNKEARVVEEVNLNKDVEERDETVKETVRKTQVDIENIEGKKKRNK